MRIAIFVTGAFCRKDYLDAVSGHVQLPLKTGEILVDMGHEVTLITTKLHQDDILPYNLTERFHIKEVQHTTKLWPDKGILISAAIKQIFQLLFIFSKHHYDALYFSGGGKIGLLLSLLSILGVRGIKIFSPIHSPGVSKSRIRTHLYKLLLRKLDFVVATSEYVRKGWEPISKKGSTRTLYPGVLKNLLSSHSEGNRNSVLFWRNANYENGADLAISAVDALAGSHRNINFVFATRPDDELEHAILALDRKHTNVQAYTYPYPEGVSLEVLLNNALFVIAPFKHLSMNPQMAILETLYANVPVIASDVESNSEVVTHEKNGIILQSTNESELCDAILNLLNDRKFLNSLCNNARSITTKKWNWENYKIGLQNILQS